jgi:CheY-like chemotaxis protein
MVHHPIQRRPDLADILVVAPTDALRESVRFLLEEEDYRVTSVATVENVPVARGLFACTVVDHQAVRAMSPHEREAFLHVHRPVVLLANGMPGVVLPDSFRVVTKPLLGAALSDAVGEAVAFFRAGSRR